MTFNKVPRKTDARTVRTKASIRSALLLLLEDRVLEHVHVKDICEHIGINRSTFYTHFDNVSEVLDEALDDLLHEDESSIRTYRCNISCDNDYNCPYGICDKVREDPRYAKVLFNESLRPYIVRKIASKSKEKYVRTLTAQCHLTDTEAEYIFYFQLNGCLAINRIIHETGFKDGERINRMIASFIQGGLTHFKKK